VEVDLGDLARFILFSIPWAYWIALGLILLVLRGEGDHHTRAQAWALVWV